MRLDQLRQQKALARVDIHTLRIGSRPFSPASPATGGGTPGSSTGPARRGPKAPENGRLTTKGVYDVADGDLVVLGPLGVGAAVHAVAVPPAFA